MNNLLNFELAKLLKEKGCNIETEFIYRTEDDNLPFARYTTPIGTNPNIRLTGFIEISAPTIAEVVMWLYEKYGIWIVLMPKRKDKGLFFGGYIDTGKDEFMKSYGSNFKSPTEAYEAAIEYTLKNLI